MFHCRQQIRTIRRAAVLCLALVGAQLAWPGAAGAAGGTIRDGRDTKGALDIAAVSYASDGGANVTQTVRLYSPLRSRALKAPRATLAFAFDTNNDRRADLLAVVAFADGTLRTVLANANGKTLDISRARRPDSRTIEVTIPTRAFREGGYRWTVLTIYKDGGRCRRRCVDVAPNRLPALFDFTPPMTDLGVPDPYNLFSTTTAFSVQARVVDKGFSRLRRWSLDERPAGQSGWATIAYGTAAGVTNVPITGSEGATYEFRLTASDAQGNVSISSRLVSIPIDDANPLLADAYTGGSWDAYVDPGSRLFQHSAHRATGPDSTFTYAFTGTYVAWLSTGGCCPRAHVSIDGGLPQTVTANGHRPFELGGLAYGRHTITISPADAVPGFEIDGIVTR